MESATAVSIRANRQYLRALRQLAEEKNQPVADLVRAAIDTAYGAEIEPILSFFAKRDYQNRQLTKGNRDGES